MGLRQIRKTQQNHLIMDITLDSIEEALKAIAKGEIVIVVDDEDRENEGDFITSAELITPEKVNFMVTHGRGVLCAPITEERCLELELEKQVTNKHLHPGTPFTVTVDLLKGCTTGVSAQDRAATIRSLADSLTKPEDLGRPGHISPLYARDKGVLRRAGHTEASIDLGRLAGLQPAAALIEIMNEDGSMARLPQLAEIARRFNLNSSASETSSLPVESGIFGGNGTEVQMPTKYGFFRLIPFQQTSNGLEHVDW
jgi:3,4-dihydroxy 2-butanone 4-phosphate synthase/GTP cyclohydrolase II